MVKDGYYFLLPLLGLGMAALVPGWRVLALLFFFLAAFVGFFFRDPERRIPEDPNAILSPADGKIIRMVATDGGTLVSIFLSIFDVHVNRAPINGEVVRLDHRCGRFRAAFDERASVENERLEMMLQGENELTFRLIAGLVARRIVAWKKKGDWVRRGDRIGLIRFGSRVDILIPPGCRLNVKKADRVRGGSSIIAYWR